MKQLPKTRIPNITEAAEVFDVTNILDRETTISAGGSKGGVRLSITQGLLWIVVDGEPTGDQLLSCFQAAREAGWLRPNMRALVDLARFTGLVDWSAIGAIRDMMPSGPGTEKVSRVAYVVRNDVFGMLIRVLRALFPRSRHALFLEQSKALAWLGCGAALPDGAPASD